jgi:hypothetical protein
MLHLLKVYLIIEVNDVLGISCLLIDHTFGVNLRYILFVLETVCVLVDDCVEGYLLLI